MSTKKLERILTELSTSSAEAAAIISRMESKSAANVFDKLQADIKASQREIARLQSLLDEQAQDQVDLDDEQSEIFKTSVTQSLTGMHLNDLRVLYTRSVLESYTRAFRYLIAVCLLNFCTNQGYEPESIWQELVSNNGDL